MSIAVLAFLASLSVPTTQPSRPVPPARHTLPVLAFPEPGLDDSAAYAGYRTRLFRDAARNTVQVYLDATSGRVVQLWADAEDESEGFTVRDSAGQPAALSWGGDGADVGRSGRARTFAYRLLAAGPRVTLGAFLLGSMRIERDFQYAGRQRAPFGGPAFRVAEVERLVNEVEKLAPAERSRELALLHASSVAELRGRLVPRVARMRDGAWDVVRVLQPSLDARDTLTLELRTRPRAVDATVAGDSVMLQARDGRAVAFEIRTTTTGRALKPLSRREIFTPAFLSFLANARARGAREPGGAADLRARRLERQVRGVELLSSRQKLMAGLPTYATYFGRDQLMSSLMMMPIWRSAMAEAVISSVLRKLGPHGEVSHEEALGGQAIRERAGVYAALVDSALAARARGQGAAADSLLARARDELRNLRRTRENYRMLDDKFQFPVLVSRWLAEPTVGAAEKRSFLLDSSDGDGSRAVRLMRELALVARLTAPYASHPGVENLVSFVRVDTTWQSASWRDSGDGYAGGRFAMDINAIWAPHALEAMARILDALHSLGIAPEALAGAGADVRPGSPLGTYVRDRAALRAAIATWHGAERHFVVRLAPAEVQEHVGARLAAMPADERDYWTRVLAATGADRDSLTFLALSLDGQGRPVDVVNTDPATRLFLGDHEGSGNAVDPDATARVLRDVRTFERAYPVGLLIDSIGPVVANDAYAPPGVWRAFAHDAYHGPRVVWGREVNLFLLGVANRLGAAGAATQASAGNAAVSADAYTGELRRAARRVRAAVAASGFHSELWSYDIVGGRVVPKRYGSGADVQLWSTTDLAVEYVLGRLGL